MKMIRMTALLLALLMLLASCGGGIKPKETAAPAGTTPAPSAADETETGEVRSVGSPTRELPNYVLPEGATPDEIRAMAVKAMRDELTVQWYVDKGFTYPNANGQEFKINAEEVYAGLPYTQSGSGLLQWLQYYDAQTGRMTGVDGSNLQGRLGNSCAAAVMWGWTPVCTSISWNTTYLMTPGHGCLPVGGYKIDPNLMSYKDRTTDQIVADNGIAVILRAYAAVQPADGLISFMDEAGAHAQMAIEPAHVEYQADGAIDPDNSYIMIQDQHKGALKNDDVFVQEVDGQRVHYAGHIAQKMTFSKLLSSNYIPVTTAEFTGAKPYTVPSVTLEGAENVTGPENITALTVDSAYKIITISAKVLDGEEVAAESKHVLGRSEIEKGTVCHYDMAKFPPIAGLSRKLEKGKTYTLRLDVLDATGSTYTPLETTFTYNG